MTNPAASTGVPAKRIRLLFVVNDIPYFLAHWSERAMAARNAGYDTHVAGSPGPGIDRLASLGLPFHPVRIVRGEGDLGADGRALRRLSHLYAEMKPDLVHHITIKPVIFGGLVARWQRVPAVVATVPGLGYSFVARGWKARLVESALRRAYRVALAHRRTRVVFENPDDLRDFERWRLLRPGQGIVIKGAGVDLQQFHPVPRRDVEPGVRVVLASRLLWDKGVGEFVEAAQQVRAAQPDARFILVGENDPASPASISTAQLRAWVDDGAVEWWGRREDMPAVLADATVVCLPSYYREGVPRVLIEAAACGRPIVTTDAPGCREIVRHEENGILVPVRDARALAEAVARLLADNEMLERMGVRGRQLAETEFGKERVIAETLALYYDLLRPSPASRPA